MHERYRQRQKCHHRHLKLCRYKDACRRRSTCLYYHIVDKSNIVNSAIQSEFEIVKAKLEDSTKKIVNITDENIKFKEKLFP